MKRPGIIVLSGFALAGVKLALLPFRASLPSPLLDSLSDCGLTLLLALAAWRASRRSQVFARTLWLMVVVFAILETISFTITALAFALVRPEKASNAFWTTTIVFYLVALASTLPLLLREDAETLGIGWLQTLDITQFAILTLPAYLVFFYIPSISSFSPQLRAHNYLLLHLMRDGFLALGYAYRALRSRFPDLRQLHLRFSAFFALYGTAVAISVQGTNVWHWPGPLIAFIGDLPALLLLWMAASWQQQAELPRPAAAPSRRQGVLWRQVFPLLLPLSVIAVASRISTTHPRVAWTTITASFLCYAVRLLVMQRQEEATLASLFVMEEKFSKAFRSSPVAISITRFSDGKFIDANDRYLQLVNLRKEELVGRTSVELGIFADAEERNRLRNAVTQQGSFRSMPFRLRVADRILDTLVSAEQVRLEDETLLISSLLDVTELKSVTQQLQQAQKMELVGSLAGGVAHDFNNLLTIIKGYSELARVRGLKGDLAEEIRQIGEAADRAAALTRQLLAFSRRQILQPRNIGLNSVVAGIEKMLRRTIGEHIKLVTLFASDIGTVHADPVQMEQVVINLAVNSRDAMQHGGKLIFQTRNLELSTPFEAKGFEIPPGRYVVLTATDTGTGIPPENLDRVFEPFFTTKEAGHGTGLGLSTVFGIVKQSGGYISVDSELGLGTTFKIYLPRVDKPVETFAPSEIRAQSLDGTETILIAEDDESICELAATVLQQRGYNVLVSNSGDEALRRASEFPGEIHLLLTDIVMSRPAGPELARQLKKVRPSLKVLYMSGYPQLSVAGGNMIELDQPILAKPFTPSELVREARRILDCENHLTTV
ncbi:MAG TPA: ATP-binding protein [Candidatus Angelobacter sp.]